jgi:hypothetical protein
MSNDDTQDDGDTEEAYDGLWVLVHERKRQNDQRWVLTDKETAKEAGEKLFLNENMRWEESEHSERETAKIGTRDTYVEPLTIHDGIPREIERKNEMKRETTPGFDTN